MTITNAYVKEFSRIDSIQQHERIHYNLLQETINGITKYGIGVVSELCECDEYSCLLSSSKNLVMSFLKFIYENAIKTDSVEDIVKDFFGNKTAKLGGLRSNS